MFIMNQTVFDDLKKIYKDAVKLREPMKEHTTFRIGGEAEYMVTPADEAQLADTVSLCTKKKIPYYIIGNGSNLLVSDQGYHGVVIRLYQTMDDIICIDDCITAGAGALLAKAAAAAKKEGLSGLEFASGIPGTVGGALMMNAGAYGAEMADITVRVKVMTPQGEIKILSGKEMEFGYRKSIAGTYDYIILQGTFRLRPEDRTKIDETMRALTCARREKQPLEFASAGSTFKRPEGYFAGKLIDDAGLSGYQVGGAKISDKHCGFVINTGDATAAEVMQLITDVKQRVYETSGVMLEPEIRFVGDF